MLKIVANIVRAFTVKTRSKVSMAGRTLDLALAIILVSSCFMTVLTTSPIRCKEEPPGSDVDLFSPNHGYCLNGGVCKNGTCACKDGWQGPECQFCGGKVRYVADSMLNVDRRAVCGQNRSVCLSGCRHRLLNFVYPVIKLPTAIHTHVCLRIICLPD